MYFPGNSQTNDYSDGSDIVTVYNEAYSQLSRQPNANTSKIVLLEREVVSLKETMEKFIKDFQTFEAKSDMFQKHQQQGQQQGRQVDEQSQEKGNRRNQLLETRSNDQREDEEIQRPHPYTATLVASRARLLKADYRFSILKTFYKVTMNQKTNISNNKSTERCPI